MDYETYKKKYFVHPAPEPRFRFSGAYGATLFYQDYQEALAFYQKVLGPPAYIESKNTHGWPIGSTWLTLFPSKKGNPENVEIPFFVETPEEVGRLYGAFIAAGAQGEPPENTLMYRPVRTAFIKDPFGVEIMVACWLGE
jgi:catechol 2,3-dioxygenase-like lactoylglutathione lyase family enzyme